MNVGSQTQTEELIRTYLEQEFPGFYFPSQQPAWLVDTCSGKQLSLDAYNVYLRLAVEYNGMPHAGSELQNRHLETKRRLCREHGVYLISVGVEVDDIERYLEDRLQERDLEFH